MSNVVALFWPKLYALKQKILIEFLSIKFHENPLIIVDLKFGVSWNITPCQMAKSLSTFQRYSMLSSLRRKFFVYLSLKIEAAISFERSVMFY
jgi:predicted 3-demethylubiquinone-9 3-methyltransferase (glyoxalase superfamily)